MFRDNELRARELEKDMEASGGAAELERARSAGTKILKRRVLNIRRKTREQIPMTG